MSDITGITNLTSSSAGDTSLTGIKAATTNLNNGKVENTTTVNGHALSGNVTVSASDAGAVPTSTTVNGKALSSNVTLGLASSDFANQGTTTTVLHGNASGNPAFGAVVEADITLATSNTTNDVSTTKHGFVPTAPNDATKFLRGDAIWSTLTANSQSYASAFTSVSSTTTQNIDTTFTTNFQPSVVTVYFKISGYENFGGELHFTRGIAVYAGTTVKNVLNFYSDSNNTILAITAATLTDAQSNPTVGNNLQTGNISATLSILSVSATNFVVRVAYSANGTPPAVAAVCTFNAVATQ